MEKCGGVKQDTDDDTIRRKRFACWITKATKYVIITVFPRQQWFRENASILRYTYIVCLLNQAEILINSLINYWQA